MHGFVCALGLQTNRSDSMIFYLLDLGQQRETRLPSVSARRPPASPCIVQQSGSHRLATFRQPAWCNIPSASLRRMLRLRVATQAPGVQPRGGRSSPERRTAAIQRAAAKAIQTASSVAFRAAGRQRLLRAGTELLRPRKLGAARREKALLPP